MKKLLLAGVALAALSGTAFAADLPRRAAPPVFSPVPVFTWTGFYVGAQVGAQWSDASYVAPNVAPDRIPFRDETSIVGGGHVGANYQIGALVIGIEGDFEGSNFSTNDRGVGGVVDTLSSDWQASIRGRLGFAADRFLIYVTGGWAFMDLTYGLDANAAGGPLAASDTVDGYTIGGGIEYAFTNNFTGRVEYRYADFGRSTAAFNGVAANLRSFDLETHTIRVGLSYKF